MFNNPICKSYNRITDTVRRKSKLETGFSVLEAVVVVGVLLAIVVGGFFAYGPITQNAKLAKVKSAASEVYTAATVAQIDGDSSTKLQDVIDTFNASNNEIEVEILEANPTTPGMSTAGYVPAAGEDFCLKATNRKNTSINAKAGACAEEVSSESPPAEEVPTAPVDPEPKDTAIYSEILKNGDFSEGLTYWSPVTGTTGISAGQAYFSKTSGISQIISIPSTGITGLQYDYKVGSASYQYAGSTLYIKAYNPAGALLKTIKTHGGGSYSNTIPQTTVTANLTEFAGQDIKLSFEVTQSDSSNSKPISVDNVSVQTTTTAPNAPTNVQTTVNDTDVTISWTPPNSGTQSLTAYTVTPYRNGEPLPVLKSTGAPPATSVVFKGITNGGSYTFKVTATNSIGESVSSSPSSAINRGPQTLQNGDFSVGLANWYNVSGNITVSSGQANFNKTGGISQTISVPSTGITGIQYDYKVYAASYQYAGSTLYIKAYSPAGALLKTIKSHGGGSYYSTIPQTTVTANITEFAGQDIKLSFEVQQSDSSNSKTIQVDNVSVQTTTTAPNAPTNVQTTVNDTDATITWSAPSSGTQSLTGYTVTPYRNGESLPVLKTAGTPPPTSVVFKGLTNGGSYTFQVTATNSIGESEPSSPSSAIDRGPQTLQNGDFSAGLANWYNVSGNITVSSGKAYFNKTGGISQTISVPSAGITTLQYDYQVDAASYQYAGSTLYIKAYSPAGALLKTVKSHGGGSYYNTIPQTTVTANLSEFAGQDIKLSFEVQQSDSSNSKTIQVDNVSVRTQ